MIEIVGIVLAVAVDVAHLQHRAEQFCYRLACPLPVKVEMSETMPRPRMLAQTTVEKGVCVLTFTEKGARDDGIVAHEACHCALDSDVIGPYGYDVVPAEAERREKVVGDCGRKAARGEKVGR